MRDEGTENTAYLQGLRTAARRVTGSIEQLCRPLDASALGWRPSEKAWSVAEVVRHLIQTADLYIPRIRRAIAREARRGPPGRTSFRPRWLAGKFLDLVGPDSKRRLTAPRVFRPVASAADPEVIDQFIERQIDIEDLISLAETSDLCRTRLPSPVTRLLRLSIGEALTLLVRHAERHTLQIERTIAALEATERSG